MREYTREVSCKLATVTSNNQDPDNVFFYDLPLFRRLTSLKFDGRTLSTNFGVFSQHRDHLIVLGLSSCELTSIRVLVNFVEQFPQLERLELKSVQDISGGAAPPCLQHGSLRELSIDHPIPNNHIPLPVLFKEIAWKDVTIGSYDPSCSITPLAIIEQVAASVEVLKMKALSMYRDHSTILPWEY